MNTKLRIMKPYVHIWNYLVSFENACQHMHLYFTNDILIFVSGQENLFPYNILFSCYHRQLLSGIYFQIFQKLRSLESSVQKSVIFNKGAFSKE